MAIRAFQVVVTENTQPLQDGGAAGGGGGSAAGGGDNVLKQNQLAALIICLKKLFNVDVKSYVQTTAETNIGFTEVITDTGRDVIFFNDASSKTLAGLNEMFYGQPTPPPGKTDVRGLTVFPPSGYTLHPGVTQLVISPFELLGKTNTRTGIPVNSRARFY